MCSKFIWFCFVVFFLTWSGSLARNVISPIHQVTVTSGNQTDRCNATLISPSRLLLPNACATEDHWINIKDTESGQQFERQIRPVLQLEQSKSILVHLMKPLVIDGRTNRPRNEHFNEPDDRTAYWMYEYEYEILPPMMPAPPPPPSYQQPCLIQYTMDICELCWIVPTICPVVIYY